MDPVVAILGVACASLAVATAWLIAERRRLLREARAGSAELLRAREGLASLRAQAAAFDQRREELLSLLKEQEARFRESFKGLAAEALKDSNAEFLRLAQERFSHDRAKAAAEIEGLVKPIGETLKKQDEKLGAMERARAEQAGALRAHIEQIGGRADALRLETARLTQSLKAPHVRGRWGELTLRRVVELSGLVDRCDFDEQAGAGESAAGGALRPDMTIRLPQGRCIVVDAKAPLSAYLEALEATDEASLRERMAAHARQVRTHMDRLASKDYQRQFENAPDVVIMFVPGDQFLAAALKEDAALIEDALSRSVVIATPGTLFAVARAVAFGWAQASLADDARAVLTLGRDLHERIAKMAEHLAKMGRALQTAAGAYADLTGNVEKRVMPAARRLEEHNVRSRATIEEPPHVQVIAPGSAIAINAE